MLFRPAARESTLCARTRRYLCSAERGLSTVRRSHVALRSAAGRGVCRLGGGGASTSFRAGT